MNRDDQLNIVMACYNGEKYISQQIDSILKQIKLGDTLIIHDDESTDNTKYIIANIENSSGEALKIIRAPSMHGASENFSFLLSQTTENYILCSDQDDIWIDGRLDLLYEEMIKSEKIYGADTPILIHSDLFLIDEKEEMISDSFWKYQNIDPSWGDYFPKLLTQNVVTGCTTIMNRALLNKALPIPKEAMMHDWWLALVACAFGKVLYISKPTINYRQHSTNELGAKKFDVYYIYKKAKYTIQSYNDTEKWHINVKQAEAFSNRYAGTSEAEVAKIYSLLPKMPRYGRAMTKLRYGFKKIGILRNIAWILL